MEKRQPEQEIGGPYANYVLVVLMIVYIFNFIDRNILSILAEDIKADLGLTDADYPDYLLLLAFSVSPGICEEFLFRGLIMSGLRPVLKRWSTIFLVSLMFGIFHISLYRILPAMVIGFVVTLVAYQTRSIWTGVLLHVLNNATLLMVSKHNMLKQAPADVPQVDAPSFFLPIPWQGTEVRWTVMSMYIVLFAAGLIILMLATRDGAENLEIAAIPAESP